LNTFDPKNLDEKILIVGIDLGTSNSVIHRWDNLKKTSMPYEIEFNSKLLPSVASYDKQTSQWLFGVMAKNRIKIFAEETISSIKKHMGKNYETLKIGGKRWTPVEISTLILQRLIFKAEGKPKGEGPVPGSKIEFAVVCHPYYYNNDNEAKKDFIKVVDSVFPNMRPDQIKLLEEPMAAAIACSLTKQLTDGETLLVLDMGGGTFDITAMKIRIDASKLYLAPLAMGGSANLGGDDFDNLIVEKLKGFIREEYADAERLEKDGVSININFDKYLQTPKIAKLLKENAENLKINLSSTSEDSITLVIHPGLPPITKKISRSDLESWFEPIFKQIKDCIVSTVADLQSDPEFAGFDRIILVGGSSNIPKLRQIVRDLFQKEPFLAPNAGEFIAKGAAYYAAISTGVLHNVDRFPWKEIIVGHPTETEKEIPFEIGMVVSYAESEIFWPIFPGGINYPSQTLQQTLQIKVEAGKNLELVFLKAPKARMKSQYDYMSRTKWKENGVVEIGKAVLEGAQSETDAKGEFTFRIDSDRQLVAQLSILGKYSGENIIRLPKF
jgi:molecular chaperone DnaK